MAEMTDRKREALDAGRVLIHQRPDHKDLSSKGGKTTAERQRRAKEFREIMETLLSMQIKKGRAANLDTLGNIAELRGKNLTVAEAIMATVVQRALQGDLSAISMIQSLTGQTTKTEIAVEHSHRDEGKLAGILKQLEARRADKEED